MENLQKYGKLVGTGPFHGRIHKLFPIKKFLGIVPLSSAALLKAPGGTMAALAWG